MLASWRTSDVTVLAATAVGTIVLTIASFFINPTDTLPRDDGSSYSAHDEGGMAAFLLIKQLGYRVERSFEPLASLRAAPPHTVLVLASPTQDGSQQDLRALRTFVEGGGEVLAIGATAIAFLPDPPAIRPRVLDEATVSAALPSDLSAGVLEIVTTASTMPLVPGSPYL